MPTAWAGTPARVLGELTSGILKFATDPSDTVCEMTRSAFNVLPIPEYSEASLPEDTSDLLSATE